MSKLVLRQQPRTEVKSRWSLPKQLVIWFYLNVVPWISYLFVTLVTSTYRWRQLASKELLELMTSGKPFAAVIWHGDMILSQSLGKRLGWNKRTVIMVALNQAGEVEARILKRLGYYVVRGSTKKRGKEALEDMKDILSQGAIAAIVVDGPSGPAREVKAGIVELARFCQVPIVPFAFLPGNEWIVPTWDRTRVPKPFSRCLTSSSVPIRVAHNISSEQFKQVQADIKTVMTGIEEQQITWDQAFSLEAHILSLFSSRNAIFRIEEAAAGLSPEKFAEDEKTRLYVLGELKGIAIELKKVKKKHYKKMEFKPDWNGLYEKAELIKNACQNGDSREIWEIVQHTMPDLKKTIEDIIEHLPLLAPGSVRDYAEKHEQPKRAGQAG